MPWLSLLSPPVGSETGGPGSSLNIEPGELETAVQTEPCGGRIITKKKKWGENQYNKQRGSRMCQQVKRSSAFDLLPSDDKHT